MKDLNHVPIFRDFRRVPLKFRGCRRSDGLYTYAEIVADEDGVYMIHDTNGGHKWEVEPDSIRQLVFCGANGGEIYEGDTTEVEGGFYPAFLEGTLEGYLE